MKPPLREVFGTFHKAAFIDLCNAYLCIEKA